MSKHTTGGVGYVSAMCDAARLLAKLIQLGVATLSGSRVTIIQNHPLFKELKIHDKM